MLHFGDAIGEHFSAFNFLPIILYFVLMLKDYLILYWCLHFLSLSERKSRINSFSISNRLIYLSLLAITYRICASLSSLCIDGGIPLSLLHGLPFLWITCPASIILIFLFLLLINPFICSRLNPNRSAISLVVTPFFAFLIFHFRSYLCVDIFLA